MEIFSAESSGSVVGRVVGRVVKVGRAVGRVVASWTQSHVILVD